MEEIGAFEAKTNLSRLLDRVQQGERLTITRHGRPVARLVPVEADRDPTDLVARMRAFAAGNRLDGLDIRTLIDEGRR